MLDDEVLFRKRLVAYLENTGAEVTAVGRLEEARTAAQNLEFDLALLDVNLPDGNGTALLAERGFPETTCVIVMTAHGGVAGAVAAVKAGAVDYLVKPFDHEEVLSRFESARRARRDRRAGEHRRSQESPLHFGDSMAAVTERLEKIVSADRRLRRHLPPILIEGETGTGKTALARWLHSHGPRADGPLVELNCSAVPESLAEAELFGHERGAFTDAKTARIGLMEAADGGTLFLDELSSLSPAMQARLLTAIEDHCIRRVGSSRQIPVDVRVIAASNADLGSLVEKGRFREDFYHRLNLFGVRLPPLRERGGDVIVLAETFLAAACRRYGLKPAAISPDGRARLLAHRWPGNLRELAHEVERELVFGDRRTLAFSSLPQEGQVAGGWLNDGYVFPEEGFSLEKAVDALVSKAVSQTGGNVSAAARLLDTSRDVVRYRLSRISAARSAAAAVVILAFGCLVRAAPPGGRGGAPMPPPPPPAQSSFGPRGAPAPPPDGPRDAGPKAPDQKAGAAQEASSDAPAKAPPPAQTQPAPSAQPPVQPSAAPSTSVEALISQFNAERQEFITELEGVVSQLKDESPEQRDEALERLLQQGQAQESPVPQKKP